MNFLCNINQSFTGLLTSYLNLIKERSSCLEVCSVKKVFFEIWKIFKNTFFQRIPLVAASKRVNAEEAAPLCSVAVGMENISGEA